MKKKPVLIALLAVLMLSAFAQALLPSVVHHLANKKLSRIGDYRGQIGRVSIHLWRGAYSIENVSFVKMNGQVPVPYFEADKIDLSLQWKSLLLRHSVVADINFDGPKFNFVTDPDKAKEQLAIKDSTWQEKLQGMSPIRINRLTVHNGEVHFRNYSANPKIDLYLHGIEAEANNLSNAKDEKRRLKATIQAAGKAMTKGNFEIFLAIDPFAVKPTFEMRGRTSMFLPELNDFLRHYLAVEAKDGRMDIYIEGSAADGAFKGYVKPLIGGLHVLQLQSESIGETIKGVFVKIAAALFENKQKKDLATKVDISGSFDDPNINPWSALRGFVQNAFFKGVLPGFEGAAKIPLDAQKLATP